MMMAILHTQTKQIKKGVLMLGSRQNSKENLIRFEEEGGKTAPIPIPVQKNKENKEI